MKKKVIMSLLLVFISSAVFSQGIEFVKSYDEAIAKAQKEGKRIFIDIATTWCAPCRIMEQQAFVDKTVGDYFNKNYVSLKIDAERGEGIDIAKRFDVSAFPTLVFLDKDGDLLYVKKGGADVPLLLKWAKEQPDSLALKVKKATKVYEEGGMNSSELKEYMHLLNSAKLSSTHVLEEYINSIKPKQRRDITTYYEIRGNNISPTDYAFEYILKNRKHYVKQEPHKDYVDSHIVWTLLFEAYNNRRTGVDNDAYFEYWSKYFELTSYVKETYNLVTLLHERPLTDDMIADFIARADKLFEECPCCMYYVMNESIKLGYGFFPRLEEFLNEKVDQMAQINKLDAATICKSYASVYCVNGGNYEKANVLLDKGAEWSNKEDYALDLVQSVKRKLGLMKCEKYGRQATDFTLLTPQGDSLSLSEFRGSLVLLDFWASWCGPCKGEVPYLKSIYEKYGDKGIVILGVSCDENKSSWLRAIEEDGLVWKHVRIADTAILKEYDALSIPRIVLLDENGCYLADELRGEQIEREVVKNMK